MIPAFEFFITLGDIINIVIVVLILLGAGIAMAIDYFRKK